MAGRAWGAWLKRFWAEQLRVSLIVAVGAGLVLAFIAPFGTETATVPVRLGYWVGVMTLGTLVGLSTRPVLHRVGWFESSVWLEAGAHAAIITAIGSVIVWLTTVLVFQVSVGGAQFTYILAPVAVLTIAMTALNYALNQQPRETHAHPDLTAPPRFIDRLPAHLRDANIRAVEAQDHYLRVHTDRGDTLILLRLADAVAELEGIEGAQTHRSWWVARGAVQSATRGDGRAELTLTGGLNVPVSRTYARSLRDAGWY